MKRFSLPLCLLLLSACADTSEGTKKGKHEILQANSLCQQQAGGAEIYNVPGHAQQLVECRITAATLYGKEGLGIYLPIYQGELRRELMIAAAIDSHRLSQQDAIILTGKVQSQMYSDMSITKNHYMQQKAAEARARRARISAAMDSLSTSASQASQQLSVNQAIPTPTMSPPVSYSIHQFGNNTTINGSDGSSLTCHQFGNIASCN